VTRLQLLLILAVTVPALAIVLWPLVRRRGALAPSGSPSAVDPTLELLEDKARVLRALKEIQFDHEAGHLSDDDYGALRDRYEARAIQILAEIDRLRPATPAEPAAPRAPAPAASAPARRPGRATPSRSRSARSRWCCSAPSWA
jgi:hypothetical protein